MSVRRSFQVPQRFVSWKRLPALVRRASYVSLILAILFIISALGCSPTTVSGGDPSGTTCDSDADCISGTQCFTTAGVCVPEANRSELAIAVVPETTNGFAPREFDQLETSGALELNISGAVSIQGKVLTSDTAEVVSAEVQAWRSSRIQRVQKIVHSGQPQGERGTDSGFVIWVDPEFQYTLWANPKAPFDEEFPPLLVQQEVADHILRDLVLAGKNDVVTVVGRAVDSNEQPILSPIEVKALANEGAARSAESVTCTPTSPSGCPKECVVSTGSNPGIVIKQECFGRFELRVPPGSVSGRAYALQFRAPADADSSNLLPNLDCDGVVLGLLDAFDPEAVQELPAPG